MHSHSSANGVISHKTKTKTPAAFRIIVSTSITTQWTVALWTFLC